MRQAETASQCRLVLFCRDVAETHLGSNARFRAAATTKVDHVRVNRVARNVRAGAATIGRADLQGAVTNYRALERCRRARSISKPSIPSIASDCVQDVQSRQNVPCFRHDTSGLSRHPLGPIDCLGRAKLEKDLSFAVQGEASSLRVVRSRGFSPEEAWRKTDVFGEGQRSSHMGVHYLPHV